MTNNQGETVNKLDKLLLNEKDAAELLGMSTHFLRRDRISDCPVGIPFIRVGGAVRYRRIDLEGWVIEQTKKPSRLPMLIERDSESQVAEKRRPGRPRKKIQVVER